MKGSGYPPLSLHRLNGQVTELKMELKQLQTGHAQEMVQRDLQQQQLQDVCSQLKVDFSHQASLVERYERVLK